jgi:hypothetical protein
MHSDRSEMKIIHGVIIKQITPCNSVPTADSRPPSQEITRLLQTSNFVAKGSRCSYVQHRKRLVSDPKSFQIKVRRSTAIFTINAAVSPKLRPAKPWGSADGTRAVQYNAIPAKRNTV